MIFPVACSMILNAPWLCMAPSKKVRNTSRRQRSLLGCCSHIWGSEATAYKASKSSSFKGTSVAFSHVASGCRFSSGKVISLAPRCVRVCFPYYFNLMSFAPCVSQYFL